ncbi:MAG: exonuclease SbcCD subunit D [Candidatus Hydrothermarchaeales archaeon]
MRFAHMADTHLGYRQYNLDEREEDFYSAFHEAIDKIIKERVDFVIHAGDLFDEPRPPVRAMIEVRNALDRLDEKEIPVFAIGGNHDILMRRGALPPQRLYKNIEFLTPERPWHIHDDVFIAGLPYHSKIHASMLKERLNSISNEAKKYKKRILVLHQGIDRYFPLNYELKFEDIPKGFDYIAMGHVHKRIVDNLLDGKLVYPGSTEVWRIDELEDLRVNGKGFNIVDIGDFSLEKIDLENIRPFIKKEIIAENLGIDELKSALDLEKNPVLHLTVLSDMHDYPGIYQNLVRELKDALYLDIKRRGPIEVEETFSEKKIGIGELINAIMKDYTSKEIDFAYALFKRLSVGELEGAKEIAEEFFTDWTAKLEMEKEVLKENAIEKPTSAKQSRLEVIR